MKDFDEQFGSNPHQGESSERPYQPKGSSPLDYLRRGIFADDILLGNGFLERASAVLLAGPSGIGKSSIAMQAGCCWSCGMPAFDLEPPKALSIVMMQNEDSANDLVRMSESLRFLGLDQQLIHKNFWIETVRGKIGAAAVKVMRDLVAWRQADLVLLNPLTAYHDGDISQNKDNIRFLYGELGALLEELRIGLFSFHHKGKPAKTHQGKNNQPPEDVYYQVMYDILGGSTLTNFFRGIITVSPIANSEVFKFVVAKRFEQSGWVFKSQPFKWHEDRARHLWVPASVMEAENAKSTAGKTLQDLLKLVPLTGTIPTEILQNKAHEAGFVRREYRALLAETLDDATPDELRLYKWAIYNPLGQPYIAFSRFRQPEDETPSAMRARTKRKKTKRRRNATKA